LHLAAIELRGPWGGSPVPGERYKKGQGGEKEGEREGARVLGLFLKSKKSLCVRVLSREMVRDTEMVG